MQPGSPAAPIILLSWDAPGGTPARGSETSLTTKYALPGAKDVSLTACSNAGCTTLTEQVVVQGTASAPSAPILRTLGCPSTAKANQLLACPSDGAPGGTSSPVTLLEWQAPGGMPAAARGATVFTTTYATPGSKQITLKACSGDACTTLSQTVTVTADVPPPLTGSGTFTLFQQEGQCQGLTISEVMQLSLSLAVNGTVVDVSVTNKGWTARGTWTDTTDGSGRKTLSAASQALPNPPAGSTAMYFAIAGFYNPSTKVLAWDTVTGFSLVYDRSGGQCKARYSFNIQLN